MSNEICNDLKELHPFLKTKAEQLIDECKRIGINIRVTETYRTVARQDSLYAQGRTKPGKIVTGARGASLSSYHQWRLAFDVCNNVAGQAYNKEVLARVGSIGKKLGLAWGGDFKNIYDSPHFEYTYGLSIKELIAGKKPPNTVPAPPKPSIPITDFTDYNKAVIKLNAKSVINTPLAWKPEGINLAYVPSLFDNIGRILLKVNGYNNIIDKLVQDKVMAPDTAVFIWKDKKYKELHVRALIIKVSDKYA